MRITISSHIKINKNDIDQKIYSFIDRNLTFINPKYKNAIEFSINKSKASFIPKNIKAFSVKGNYIYVSRGFLDPLLDFFNKQNIYYTLRDKTITNESSLELSKIKLRPYQKKASVKAIRKTNGVIKMPCGAGKTITLTDIIRKLKQNTLIIVHTNFIMNQWKNYFLEKYDYTPGVIQGDICDIKPITLAMIPTLYARNLDNDFLNYWGCVVTDECFSPDTLVMLPNGKYTKIKTICERDEYTHVMSYNTETNKYESKKIVRKIVNEHNDKWLRLTIKSSNGIVRRLKTTPNHKFWTTKGYKKAKDVTDKDVLKLDIRELENNHICEFCFEYFPSRSIQSHRKTQHEDNSAFFNGEKWYNNVKKAKKIAKKISRSLSKSKKNAIARSIVMKKRWKDPKYRNYMIECAKYWHKNIKTPEQKEKQLKNFVNAPRHKNWQITKLEKKIIGFNIPNLKFTGDGKVWLTSNGIRMNPDFVVDGEKKVVEVGDTNYWHTEKDIIERIKLYKNIGWECLYVKDTHLNSDENKVKIIINQFVHNHKAKVINKKYTGGTKAKYRYNLEIEDNHNYFANGVLVSNCHRTPCDQLFSVVNQFPAKYRFGATATARRSDGLTNMIFATLGGVVYNIKAKTLDEDKYLTIPKVKILNTNFISKYSSYHGIVKEICGNKKRNELIAKNIYSHKERFNLVLSNRIQHLQKLVNEYAKFSGDYKLITGSIKTKERNETINRMLNGELHVIFSTQLADEGLDIPNLDVLHLAFPSKSDGIVEQRVGRLQRYKQHTPLVFDYVDQLVPNFYNFTQNRLNLYRELEIEVETVEQKEKTKKTITIER